MMFVLCSSRTHTPIEEKKRKEKKEKRPYSHTGLLLITVFRDAVYGFMAPLGRWTLVRH
jgi:hypothetical protein